MLEIDAAVVSEPMSMTEESTVIEIEKQTKKLTLAVKCKTFENLEQQRMEEEFCDVVLQVEDKEFPAHRCVLAASSDYFMKMFTIDMKEKHTKKVPIETITATAMREILRSIYTNEIIFTLENLGEILYAASLMQLEGVVKTATSYTMKVIDITNCFWFRDFMSKHPCKGIEEVINCYFQQNMESISALPDYNDLSFNELDMFFSSDDLNVTNEKIVFELLLKWINEHQEFRKEHFPALFNHVRLSFIPIDDILKNVMTSNLVKQFHECRDFVDAALEYHIKPTYNAAPRFRKCFIPAPDTLMLLPYRQSYQAMYNVPKLVDIVPKPPLQTFTFGVSIKDASNPSWQKFKFDGLSNGTVWQDCAVANKHPVSVLCGGIDNSSRCTNLGYRFDGIRWLSLPSMNERRCGAAAVFFDEDLFIFGGEKSPVSRIKSKSTLENSGFCLSYEKLAEGSCNWEIGENLHACRSYFAAQTVGEKIYLIGGYHYQQSSQNSGSSYKPAIGTTVVFSSSENKWNVAASLNDARAEFGCAVVCSKIYVFGGNGSKGSFSINSVEILNIDENLWTRVGSVSISGPMSACCIDERTYLLCASNKQILLYKDAKKGKQCSSSAIDSNIPEGNILLPFAQQFYINPVMKIQSA